MNIQKDFHIVCDCSECERTEEKAKTHDELKERLEKYGEVQLIDDLQHTDSILARRKKNQEDAEKLKRVDSLFAELEIPPPYDLWLAESIQIRERLKNRIYFHGMQGASGNTAPIQDAILSELQKILGGEK